MKQVGKWMDFLAAMEEPFQVAKYNMLAKVVGELFAVHEPRRVETKVAVT